MKICFFFRINIKSRNREQLVPEFRPASDCCVRGDPVERKSSVMTLLFAIVCYAPKGIRVSCSVNHGTPASVHDRSSHSPGGEGFSRASRCLPTLLNMTAVGRLLNFGQEKKRATTSLFLRRALQLL